MDFQFVKRVLSSFDVVDLPGEDAQFKMLPSIRPRISWDQIPVETCTKAAVLLLLYPIEGKANFALIKRTSYKGAHSSQISLPGGKLEAGESHLDAALREASEEIGINANDVEVLFPLTKVWVAPSNFIVTPFVGVCAYRPQFVKDDYEVDEILEVSLNDLLDDGNFFSTFVNSSYVKELNVNAFRLNNKTVWGATAMMLSEFKDLVVKICRV